jgi:DNA modification methylase
MQKVAITKVKPNPRNPRIIKDNKFKQLVKSIKEFPEMLEKRPIVCVTDADGKYIVLGGNMRLKALNELKYKEVPIILADDWSEEQRDQFLIADNVNFGTWDWDILANEWETATLVDWGLEIQGVDTSDFFQPSEPSAESEPLDYSPEVESVVHTTLSDKFIAPPFSVFDTKQGYWQKRKAEWKSLGIKSEVGRGGNLLNYSDTILSASNPAKALADALKGSSPNTASVESKIPNYYAKREAGLSDAEIIKEFIDKSELSGTSVFDPVLCEISYKWFCIPDGQVLDPFAGGSVRGIVASKVGLNYTGIDLREEQVDANRKQVDEICESHPPKYIVGTSEQAQEIASGEYDLIFTCPPYYDLEQYSDDPQDLSNMEYKAFEQAYEGIIAQCIAMLKPDSFSVFVVGDVRDKQGYYLDFIGKTIQAHEKAGARLYNSAILLESVGTAGMRASRIFNGGRKLTKVHQNVLVFYKGDASKIKGKFTNIMNEDVVSHQGVSTEFGERINLLSEI